LVPVVYVLVEKWIERFRNLFSKLTGKNKLITAEERN